MFLTVSFALGTGSSFGSVTVPTIVAVPVWAAAPIVMSDNPPRMPSANCNHLDRTMCCDMVPPPSRTHTTLINPKFASDSIKGDSANRSNDLFVASVREPCRAVFRRWFGHCRSRRSREAIPETHQPDLTRRGIHQNIGRFNILMNQLPPVQPAQCRCEADGEA